MASVLRAADVRMVVTSPTTCDVTMIITVDSAQDIDHRIDAAHVELVDIAGAHRVGEIREIGHTQSLVLQPERPTYELRYRAEQSPAKASRCPLWLPNIATDGVTRAVTLTVDLPSSTIPAGTMPAFAWNGTHGVATLGHLPAFVRVPFGVEGDPPSWGIGPTMDAIGVFVMVLAIATWMRRWKR
jgi:hypothetical protein